MNKFDIFDLLSPYFSRRENWGDPDKINPALLFLLFRVRNAAGLPIIIHNAYELTGHSEKSQHYIGNAADFHFKHDNLFYSQIEMMEKVLSVMGVADKVGLGVYPQWKTPGFHIDVRGFKARWAQIDGKYVAFDAGYDYSINNKILGTK